MSTKLRWRLIVCNAAIRLINVMHFHEYWYCLDLVYIAAALVIALVCERRLKCLHGQVPPESVLLPISTHLVHFLNKRQPKLQARDAGIWWGTLGKLQLMLRKAARALYQNDKVGPHLRISAEIEY